ncbi:hypothetical protein GH984_03535 [Spiribacter sp. C176]|uniref:Uncharacterized protein n=1 Tax=Spiribacter salilacus TaxID=2664894 RepID=A0A6N7QRJ6_9GAMM|nr:hypothetical protein [Spiribacter salilacus]MRH77768.1 hypothetical protein [Spiribacter salilacus]
MGFLKIGEKDKDGRQKRIEHTGRYLRVSRTGGVALRAHVKAGGINITGNTRHGLRLSTRLAKNTQIAMQNGRFILRGRYGSDAARINLSKTGVTVSTKTPIGAINWVKPGRSSVKIAGVQMRGQKAAVMQLIYLVWMAVASSLRMIFGGLNAVVQMLHSKERLGLALDEVKPVGEALIQQLNVDLTQEPARDLFAGLVFIVTALGRGQTQFQPNELGMPKPQTAVEHALLDDMTVAGTQIVGWLNARVDDPLAVLGVMQQLAVALAARADTGFKSEALLSLDDACLASGPRTVLQDEMIDLLAEIFAVDFAIEGE